MNAICGSWHPAIPDRTLLSWRYFLSLYAVSSVAAQWQEWSDAAEPGVAHMRYFTNITYLLFCISTVALCSFQIVCSTCKKSNESTVSRGALLFAKIIAITWQCACCCSLFLDVVYWSVLRSNLTDETNGFSNVNKHLINSLLMLGSFAINNMHFPAKDVLFVLLYALLYAVISVVYFAETKEWIYFFLNWHNRYVAAYYAALISGLLVTYLALYLLGRLKKKFSAQLLLTQQLQQALFPSDNESKEMV